jgi:hypothetical protein
VALRAVARNGIAEISNLHLQTDHGERKQAAFCHNEGLLPSVTFIVSATNPVRNQNPLVKRDDQWASEKFASKLSLLPSPNPRRNGLAHGDGVPLVYHGVLRGRRADRAGVVGDSVRILPFHDADTPATPGA